MSENRTFYELPLSYPTVEDGDIQVLRDIPYVGVDDPGARLDLFLPAAEAPQDGYIPLLFIHGGPLPASGERPWPKEWRVFQDYGRLAAANGMAGVVINHRYSGYEGLVQAMADVQSALLFLANKGETYHLDQEKRATWLFSGAGMLLNALLADDVPALDCLVAFYPLLDLIHIPQAADIYSDDELMALSPLSQIDRMPSQLPMLFARAGLDRPGLNRALDTFVKQALYHNLDLELHNLPQAAHGFDMFDDSAAVQDIIERGIEFVKKWISLSGGQLTADHLTS